MTKKENIKADLEAGLVVNWLHNIKRYGTSCRSRIAELRADGMKIDSRVADKESGALEYYSLEAMRKHGKSMKRIQP